MAEAGQNIEIPVSNIFNVAEESPKVAVLPKEQNTNQEETVSANEEEDSNTQEEASINSNVN